MMAAKGLLRNVGLTLESVRARRDMDGVGFRGGRDLLFSSCGSGNIFKHRKGA
jgi:hypothetical protein